MNDTVKAIAPAPGIKLAPVTDNSEFSSLLDSDRFAQIQRVAKLFSESDLVPEVFQGKPANCAVALQMAFRMQIDPMMLMQNMYIVYGRPGIEAKLAIALMNQRGPFEGPVQWRFDGEGEKRSCTAYATHRGTGQRCEATVPWSMVKAEGWIDKKGSKWLTMPDVMFQYRSAMFLGRLYCPEVLLGLPAADELADIGPRVVSGDAEVQIARTIPLPRAKEREIEAPAEVVDVATGEITPPVAAERSRTADPAPANMDIPAATENAPMGDLLAQAAPEPAAQASKPASMDNMKRLASDAQRKSVAAIANRRGTTLEDLDIALLEILGFNLATLPMGLVNRAIDVANKMGAAA